MTKINGLVVPPLEKGQIVIYTELRTDGIVANFYISTDHGRWLVNFKSVLSIFF